MNFIHIKTFNRRRTPNALLFAVHKNGHELKASALLFRPFLRGKFPFAHR